MRKFLLTIGFLTGCSFAQAAGVPVVESPILGYGTPTTVSISSSTLTKVPTSQTAGRNGVYVTNPSTNSVAGFLGDCTSTALASTIRPIQFSIATVGISENIFYFPIREDVCLWLISLNSGAATSIHYQEVKK